MIQYIPQILSELPALIRYNENWDSLRITKRKPFTYRAWQMLPSGLRVCLHKFDPCYMDEAFVHPHPWPGVFIIMEGSYEMRIAESSDRFTKPIADSAKFNLTKWSSYEILSPLTWHAVVPNETTYTIMINDQPFSPDVVHTDVRTTVGKDLEKMTDKELDLHLDKFYDLVTDYLNAKGIIYD